MRRHTAIKYLEAEIRHVDIMNCYNKSNNDAPGWNPSSWKNAVAKQLPTYEDETELNKATATLDRVAPLVFAGEVRSLHEKLAQVCRGQGIVLMGGDCAESFKEFHVNHIRDTFRVLLQMALVMTYGMG